MVETTYKIFSGVDNQKCPTYMGETEICDYTSHNKKEIEREFERVKLKQEALALREKRPCRFYCYILEIPPHTHSKTLVQISYYGKNWQK